jgi:hypothetical protein
MFKVVQVMLGLAALLAPIRADTHIYAGAAGTNQNDKLFFSNGSLFDAALTDYSFPQILRTNGLNVGYYRGDVLTFTVLAATVPNGGPIPGSPALGAQAAVQVVSVAGPLGGSFAFWEGDGESSLGAITFIVPVDTTNGTNYFVISQNNGEPGTDPYGHFHGRVFTCNTPGTYFVGFRLIDLSTNGVGGSPIHLPSDLLSVRFQAGLRIETIRKINDRVTVSFRSPPGISNLLEVSDSKLPPNWQISGAPLRGNNNLQSLAETNTTSESRFYRIRLFNNLP